MASRRQRRQRHRKRRREQHVDVKPQTVARTGIDRFYHDKYKQLFIVTIVLLAFSLVTIGVMYASTGEVFRKGVSLSGGLTITVPTSDAQPEEMEARLSQVFPDADIMVREVSELGTQVATIIEAAPARMDQDSLAAFERSMLDELSREIPNVREIASSEVIGSSLGQSFFRQTAKAVLIAFVFMGLVVFLYFGDTVAHKLIVTLVTLLEAAFIWYAGNIVMLVLALLFGVVLAVAYVRYSIPSAAVILAAISTILFTIATVDLLGMRISTAGVAAFLMLIGYSVDTDILLSTRVLRRSGGSVYDRIMSTVKTGLTMECSTMAAALVALIFTQSDVIREIMTIIFIGLVADVFFTWIQNAGILRLYLEKGEHNE